MKFVLFLILFFVLCSLIVINNNDLRLSEKEDIHEFSELYLGWFDKFYNNVQNATGYVVKMSWVPESSE